VNFYIVSHLRGSGAPESGNVASNILDSLNSNTVC